MIVLLAALVIAVSASPQGMAAAKDRTLKAAPGGRQGSVLAVRSQIRFLESQITQLAAQYVAAQQNLKDTTAWFNMGLAPRSDVAPLEVEVEQLRDQLLQCKAALVEARRLAALAQPVDIVLKSASIRQAAEALSRVSAVKISVDAKVPKNVYVKTQARDVPLGAVVEVIANAAHLIIAPSDDGGLVLRPPGKLVVNGASFNYQGDNWPWSDDWVAFASGGAYRPLGRRWLRLFDSATYLSSPPETRPMPKPAPSGTAGTKH
jgi:hypothetical protein